MSKGRIAFRGFGSMTKKKISEAGRKGGKTVSKDKRHMAEIGKKGGKSSGRSRRAAGIMKSVRS